VSPELRVPGQSVDYFNRKEVIKMAKTIDEKEKFIELRAKGFSFDKISKELGISKPTAMRWEKEFEREIKEFSYILYESMRDQFAMTKKERIERLGNILERIRTELDKRDFSTLQTEKLINIYFSMSNKFKKELNGISCESEELVVTPLYDFNTTEKMNKPKFTWSIKD